MKKRGAQILIEQLEKQGIETIAGIPGGNNLPIYAALNESKIRHILARHEQGAAFIAQGMARSTGKPAVCLATSGPGAANLLTALADAKSDSVPIIAITGQVPTTMRGTDAFQEIDICAMAVPAVKATFYIDRACDIPGRITEAFRIATTGRPGPVLIDIPKDIQNEWVAHKDLNGKIAHKEIETLITDEAIKKAAQMIAAAKRPVIISGNGAIISGASPLIARMAREYQIPVATTLHGLGSFPASDPLFLGMPGMHGSKATNLLLHKTDLLLALGIRFDDRLTGKLSQFCPDAKVIHIDINPAEIGKIRKPDLSMTADLKEALERLVPCMIKTNREEWMMEIQRYKSEFGHQFTSGKDEFIPASLIRAIRAMAPEDAIITTDVGQHQMWVAQHYDFERPRTLLTSGGQGTMGFGLPAAIGAAIANPDRKVIVFSGDGSLLMNIQELATLADLGANITLFVMNNQQLGLVRQQQELFYDKKYSGSIFQTKTDFAAAARAFGIPAIDLETTSLPVDAIESALNHHGPMFINVPVSGKRNVFPMVTPGGANIEMIEE